MNEGIDLRDLPAKALQLYTCRTVVSYTFFIFPESFRPASVHGISFRRKHRSGESKNPCRAAIGASSRVTIKTATLCLSPTVNKLLAITVIRQTMAKQTPAE